MGEEAKGVKSSTSHVLPSEGGRSRTPYLCGVPGLVPPFLPEPSASYPAIGRMKPNRVYGDFTPH